MSKLVKPIIIFIITASSLYPQFGSSVVSDARFGGMAGTLNALAKGSYSIGINPANLYMPDLRGDLLFLVPVPQLIINAGSDFMTMNQVNYFFGGKNGKARYLSDEDVNSLNSIFQKGGDVSYNASLRIIAFSFNLARHSGLLGFSVTDVAAGQFHVPEGVMELPLKGNMLNKFYSFNDAGFQTWWIRNYSASFAKEFIDLRPSYFSRLMGGITLKLIHGYFYAGTEQVNSFFRTGSDRTITARAHYLAYTSFSENFPVTYTFDSTDRKDNNYQIFPRPAGSGFGFDVGASAVMDKVWNFSFSITDIGFIKWKSRAAQFVAHGDIVIDDIVSPAQRDSLINVVSGDGEYISGFSTGLPTALRMGASYSFKDANDGIPGNLTVAADLNQGFNDLPGNSVIPRLSVAGEWQPLDWGFLRTGFSAGGLYGFSWAVGIGLQSGIMEINFATTTIKSLLAPNDSKRLSFAVNSRWRFR